MQKNLNDYNLVTVEQATELMGVCRTTFFKMVRLKLVKPVSFPTLKMPVLLFDKTDLLDSEVWIRENAKPTLVNMGGNN